MSERPTIELPEDLRQAIIDWALAQPSPAQACVVLRGTCTGILSIVSDPLDVCTILKSMLDVSRRQAGMQ
jgi:hypothetical protein